MHTLTLSTNAIKMIDSYLHFSNGTCSVSLPYFNNRRSHVRHGLRSLIGKGSPHDIQEELNLIAFREHVDLTKMDSASFKKYLVAHNLGIDCSGFAFYILDSEYRAQKHTGLGKKLHHPLSKSILRSMISYFRTVENTNVATFAHDENSRVVPLQDVRPGDFISIIHDQTNSKHDHILVIHKVDYENNIPATLYYSHSMAWPSDGEVNTGVRQGEIIIVDVTKPITDQQWTEQDKRGNENYTYMRAQGGLKTEVRRLHAFNK